LGLELIEERFSDDGLSGATLERPALLRLLEVVRSRGIDRLVIYRLNRLTRNLKHLTTLFEELKNNDVELDVATAPETGAAALDTLMLNILASFSEFERDRRRPGSRNQEPIRSRTEGGSPERRHLDTMPACARNSWSSARKKPRRSGDGT